MVYLIRRFSTFPSRKCSCWRILFFGTDDFSLASLRLLNQIRDESYKPLIEDLAVVTKCAKGHLNSVQRYAKVHNLRSFNWPITDAQAIIGGGHFDLGIVVSFGHLIPADVIQQFPLGMLNVHGSLLPRWRGAAPVVHTILNGDTVTGVTIMKIAPYEFDVGRILLQQSCTVPPRATTPQLTSILGDMGANLLIECMRKLKNNLSNSVEQDSSLATKAPKIRLRMAQLDFEQQTRLEIDRLHRAISDTTKLQACWHGAIVRLDDIVEPEVMESVDCLKFLDKKMAVTALKPGSFVYHKRRKILCILFKDGWVGFRSVRMERKRTMSAAEFYNGFISKVTPERMHFTSLQNKTRIK